MASKNLPSTRRKAQPKRRTIEIVNCPRDYRRLLELAAKRGYSKQALVGLLLTAMAAKEINHQARRTQRSRKAVERHA